MTENRNMKKIKTHQLKISELKIRYQEETGKLFRTGWKLDLLLYKLDIRSNKS